MKITCDIINDLMPSYIDNICSEDSRKALEEHVRTCDKCNQKLQYMKKPIKCPEMLEKNTIKNPFLKIRRRSRLQLIIAVFITVCIVGGGMFAIQEVGAFHEFFYPSSMAVINNEEEVNEWHQLNISGKKTLIFDSVFYDKEMVNDANSSGDVMVRIIDENNNVIVKATTVEPGKALDLKMLKNNQHYIVEAKCKSGSFFLNFL